MTSSYCLKKCIYFWVNEPDLSVLTDHCLLIVLVVCAGYVKNHHNRHDLFDKVSAC